MISVSALFFVRQTRANESEPLNGDRRCVKVASTRPQQPHSMSQNRQPSVPVYTVESSDDLPPLEQRPPRFAVKIPDGVTEIRKGAFVGCKGLVDATIPGSVTQIGAFAFRSTRLASLDIPDGVTRINRSVFCKCTELVSLVIPGSVVEIGEMAFASCTGLTEVDIPDGVTNIGDGAFANCIGLTSLVVPDSVTTINGSVFFGCTGLINLVIPDGVIRIETFAFAFCKGLTKMVLPGRVQFIGNGAFQGCSGLTSLFIPSSVAEIGKGAFGCCTGLIVTTVANSHCAFGSSVFVGCSRLSLAVVAATVLVCGGNRSLRSLFCRCPSLRNGPVPWSTKTKQQVAALTYWSRKSHPLCSTTRREWILAVFVASKRLSRLHLFMPVEMWEMILGMMHIYDLGQAM